MCKSRIKCCFFLGGGSIAIVYRALYRSGIYWRPSIFMLCCARQYFVKYALNPNSMMEIAPELLPQGHCSSPNFSLFVQ